MKKFRIIISMLFTIILLMGCGGGGDSGDSRAITPQVKYDATGTWDFQAYDHHVVCNGIRCDICDDEGVRIFNEFKEIQEVQVIQNNDKFQMTYNGETEESSVHVLKLGGGASRVVRMAENTKRQEEEQSVKEGRVEPQNIQDTKETGE